MRRGTNTCPSGEWVRPTLLNQLPKFCVTLSETCLQSDSQRRLQHISNISGICVANSQLVIAHKQFSAHRRARHSFRRVVTLKWNHCMKWQSALFVDIDCGLLANGVTRGRCPIVSLWHFLCELKILTFRDCDVVWFSCDYLQCSLRSSYTFLWYTT